MISASSIRAWAWCGVVAVCSVGCVIGDSVDEMYEVQLTTEERSIPVGYFRPSTGDLELVSGTTASVDASELAVRDSTVMLRDGVQSIATLHQSLGDSLEVFKPDVEGVYRYVGDLSFTNKRVSYSFADPSTVAVPCQHDAYNYCYWPSSGCQKCYEKYHCGNSPYLWRWVTFCW